ncbi:MAG: acyl-CoA reductase [Bacteroidetes bacterium]|nr:acyl-CoA reductase [Bacteroidota bacterium]
MDLNQRIDLLVKLGEFLEKNDEFLDALIQRTQFNNKWFTIENYHSALDAIQKEFLDRGKLEAWIAKYNIPPKTEPKSVGLVLAGNIPLVGFHDVLTVFIAGHKSLIKLSSKDQFVLPYLIKKMIEWDPRAEAYFEIVNKLEAPDAVLATGSNNSARYFETYFGKYPNIIRRNRNAVAVLTGEESREDFLELGKDIFTYFGLGCRNVSKIYVPTEYNFDSLLEALHDFREMVLHSKYKNNFDYNYALFLLNQKPFLSNGCLMVTEDESLQSRIGVLHYSFYGNKKELHQELINKKDEIQLVVSKTPVWDGPNFTFGQAQNPALDDYADGVDTLEFLLKL